MTARGALHARDMCTDTGMCMRCMRDAQHAARARRTRMARRPWHDAHGTAMPRYAAEVLSAKPDEETVTVSYDDLFEGPAGTIPIREELKSTRIRPKPPNPPADWAAGLTPGMRLELRHDDGWWPVDFISKQVARLFRCLCSPRVTHPPSATLASQSLAAHPSRGPYPSSPLHSHAPPFTPRLRRSTPTAPSSPGRTSRPRGISSRSPISAPGGPGRLPPTRGHGRAAPRPKARAASAAVAAGGVVRWAAVGAATSATHAGSAREGGRTAVTGGGTRSSTGGGGSGCDAVTWVGVRGGGAEGVSG